MRSLRWPDIRVITILCYVALAVRSEDHVIVPANFTGTTWGGFGAWNATYNCTKIAVIGHHFGGAADVARGRVNVTINGAWTPLLEDVRHQRLTCCIPNATTIATIVVYVGGQTSMSVVFNPSKLVRKPIIQV